MPGMTDQPHDVDPAGGKKLSDSVPDEKLLMALFIGCPAVAVVIMAAICQSQKFVESSCLPHTGIIGEGIGFGVGMVFLLIAAFTFADRPDKENRHKTVTAFGKWISASTSLLFLFTLSGWYLTAFPPMEKEGMVFTHPVAIGKIYNYVNNGPLFLETYEETAIDEFQKRTRTLAEGIFADRKGLGRESGDMDNEQEADKKQTCWGKGSGQLGTDGELIAGILGMPFFIAFGFSLVGAAIWALMDILERERKKKDKGMELLPRHYLSYLVRCVTAPFLAIVIAFFMASNWPVHLAPALFVTIGMFPKRGINFVTSIGVQTMGGNTNKTAHPPGNVPLPQDDKKKGGSG